jgi:hypothetical protein
MMWRMGQTAAVVACVLGTAAGGLGTASTAVAEPATDPILCQYRMSDPEVVDVSGTPMVFAWIEPGACTGVAEPIETEVCLNVEGGATAGKCTQRTGPVRTTVYLSPYEPGKSYTVRGRGCANQTQPPLFFCSTLGPKTATL